MCLRCLDGSALGGYLYDIGRRCGMDIAILRLVKWSKQLSDLSGCKTLGGRSYDTQCWHCSV